MQIRGPDFVLSTSWYREVRGAEQFAHLLDQAEFPEMFGGVCLRCINGSTPFVRKKVPRRIRWELAPSFCIHALECLNGSNDRLGRTRAREGERSEQIWKEGAQKGVM